MTKEEKAAAMADDPLPKFRAALIAAGHASEELLAALQTDIEAEIADAQGFARRSWVLRSARRCRPISRWPRSCS